MSLPSRNAASAPEQAEPRDEHAASVARFREQYVAKLAAPYGWWAIASLDWLEPGEQVLGSAAGSRLPLPPGAPERAAVLALSGEEVVITPLVGGLELDFEPLEGPVVRTGNAVLLVPAEGVILRVNLIKRGDRFGVRVYDPRLSQARDPEAQVAWFDVDPGWVVEAEWVPGLPGETIAIVNALGQVSDVAVSGRAVFDHAGRRQALVATPAGAPGRLFFNFRDATNVSESYGGGRFLNVDGPVDGRLVLDFNLAHHPPCAHTPFATCPVPPEENRLPFEVKAGERYAEGAGPLD